MYVQENLLSEINQTLWILIHLSFIHNTFSPITVSYVIIIFICWSFIYSNYSFQEEIELQDRKGTATYSISITDGDTNTITPSPSSHPSSLLVRRQKYNSNISNNSDNNINNNNCNNNNNNNNNISNNTLNNSQNDNGNDNNNNDNKKLLVEDSFNECRGKRKRKRKVCSVFGEERFNDKIRNKVIVKYKNNDTINKI